MLQVIPVLLLAGLAGAAQQTPGSAEKEVTFGAELADDFRKHSTMVNSGAAQRYVERLGRRLAPYFPDPPPFTYKFSITADAGDPNYLHEPCTFPGGHIFVPAGLFFSALDEVEFAGVLAHAMAHVAARHGTRFTRSGQSADLASIPLVFAGSFGSCRGGRLLLPLGFLKSARANELDADQPAVRAMARAGYDPAALIRYIRREQVELEGKAADFSPLPPREKRLASLNDTMATLPPAAYSEGPDFTHVRGEVRTLLHELQPVQAKPSLRR